MTYEDHIKKVLTQVAHNNERYELISDELCVDHHEITFLFAGGYKKTIKLKPSEMSLSVIMEMIGGDMQGLKPAILRTISKAVLKNTDRVSILAKLQ